MLLQVTVRSLFLLALLGGPARAGVVTIAERPYLPPFATIQAGVDAALEGESLLVAPGAYAPFTIDAKSVQVFVTGNGLATIAGTVSVKNLGASQFVVLTGLDVTSVFAAPFVRPALDVANVAGHVRVQDSTFRGHQAQLDSTPRISGQGARLASALHVVFSACSLSGGPNRYVFGDLPIDGGAGLEAVDSSVAAYDCTFRGGDGSYESAPRGGLGGPGCSVTGFGVFLSGCTTYGGSGGGGDYVACLPGGNGGDGLVVDAAQARVLASTFQGGFGGPNGCGGNPSPAGLPTVVQNGALLDLLPGTGRRLSAARITVDDLSVPITVTGAPGDLVYLFVARRPSFVFQKPHKGTWMVPTPYLASALPAGTIGANGTLVLNRTFDIPDGTVAARLFWLQAICVDVTGQPTLTGPAHVLSLE